MTAAIEVSRLEKSYQDLEILKNLDFRVSENEIVAIVGPSGSGKSTLLSILAGLDRPTGGSISIMGKNLETMNELEVTRFRARHVGFVFQQFHLMPQLTALENVSLPLEIRGDSRAAKIAKEFLEKVGLGHRVAHLPQKLSGGECQRVAIARALACAPDIIFADEPSGNLDAQTGAGVMEMLFELTKRNKRSLILVTHNDELARACDRRFLLIKGRLEEIK